MAFTKANQVELTFRMQQQQQPTWCWAAVGTSCALFYQPSSAWTQCQLAGASIKPAPGNCCEGANASPCYIVWYLQNQAQLGSFVTAGIADRFVTGAISFEELATELDQGRVVAFRMEIELDKPFHGLTKFAHFVVIAAYNASEKEQLVTVYDSFFGNSEMAFKTFVENYKCQNGQVEGDKISRTTVSHTFFTKPPPQN